MLYGSVVGAVKDAQGAAIPAATVTITNKETNLTRETVTGAEGDYTVTNVPPGHYDVKVSLTGFREFVQTNVPVSAGQISRVDVKLEIGALTETVTVASDAQLLQTDKSDLHTELKSKEITNLPLNQYRNYQTLINLVPGATPATFQNAQTDTPGRSLRTNINGADGQNNNTRIDGASSVNIWLPHHAGLRRACRDDRDGEHRDEQFRRGTGHGRRRVDHRRHQVGHQHRERLCLLLPESGRTECHRVFHTVLRRHAAAELRQAEFEHHHRRRNSWRADHEEQAVLLRRV